jgi:EAL domain-containing protein (putative c-di-GMP-specific phosphodiesterase class I)
VASRPEELASISLALDAQGPEEVDVVAAAAEQPALPPLPEAIGEIAGWLQEEGALGLILVDASPLGQIERLYGTDPFHRALTALAQRLRNRLTHEVGERFTIASGAMAEEHLLVFLHRPREDQHFFQESLPRLTNELRGYVELSVKRVAYPYLSRPEEIPVGNAFTFHRTFQRAETQIRVLIEKALEAARFELERHRRERVDSLERVLLEESVVSVYEPIVQLADRHVIGYEALARGPVGTGLETPMALFSAADQGDLTYELDVLCRRRALAGAREIDASSRLFLNILPSSIHDPDFTELGIRRALDGLPIGPRNLVLEISEREAISNFPIFREAVDHISRLGVGIALDDTGAGYSSLEAAMELCPDFLKIDMSLVRTLDEDPQRQELLRSLQGLAANMNSRLIAEGIETEAELGVLRELGIDLGQGFLFGRGGPIGNATKRRDGEE